MLLSVKSTAISAITAFSLMVTVAAPAQAWGQREQDVLKGIVATLAVGALLRNSKRNAQPVYPAPIPVVYTNIYRTPAAAAFNSYSSNERRRIQSTLTAYGYYHSSIDGTFGPKTYNAVVRYANATGKSRSLTSTGGAYAFYDGLLF